MKPTKENPEGGPHSLLQNSTSRKKKKKSNFVGKFGGKSD